ncbi:MULTISPECIES: hypothetical protein [unclassified Rhizobium]|uniref:hypothetical protein n=1 Tax=unclassified Rhizobium TaxID=2613769 RepID=UPI001C8356CB|nr:MULTISPECIES: hypothetical protein [unclassified Rhizobium]MBX5166764.1 hypothetical protein [Rhizobium sp. NZLR4b]MBX5186302.1 hypothetical protein [Rhizobium sp. NZLR5]
MGQAKQRAQSYNSLKQRLLDRHHGPARTVATAAINLFDGFILPRRFTGACYQLTMTLQKFLADKHGIATQAVVGYVNDGTDDIMISHGWLEYEGMKIDLGLHIVERPDVVRPGALLVLDETLRLGAIDYTYHLARPEASLQVVQRMLADPATARIAQHKEKEHDDMLRRSRDARLRDLYLTGAPAGSDFASMTSVLI